jgi:imidazolonepropionase-like amidohydrolase
LFRNDLRSGNDPAQDAPDARSRRARHRWLGGLTVAPLLLFAACGGDAGNAPAEVADAQAFTNASIFDGTGGPVVEGGVLVVEGGKIVAAGAADEVEVPSGAEVVDLGGRWVVPGLINAHAHVDDASGQGPSAQEQLEVYAHYGVTTAISLGESTTEALSLRSTRESPDLQHARVYAAGPIFTPMTADSARAAVQQLATMGVDWVKIRVDSFLGSQQKMPPEAYEAVIETARENGLPVAVHLVELEDAKGVVQAGASLVAHSVRDQPVDDELISMLTSRNICVVPTFTRELSTYTYAERPEFFDDPFFLERAAPADLEGFFTPALAQSQTSEGANYWREHLPVAEDNMRRLQEGGVSIAFGTDSGTGFPGRFQGYLEHVELEMMTEAGFTPEEALLSATGVTARCVGLEGVVGTLQPGAWADFIVLDANPVEDIRNTREIQSVWIAGNQVR